MPLSFPISIFFIDKDIYTYNPENIDKDVWSIITGFSDSFTVEDLIEKLTGLGLEVSIETLKYLDKLVKAKEIINVDNLFSLKNAYKKIELGIKERLFKLKNNRF